MLVAAFWLSPCLWSMTRLCSACCLTGHRPHSSHNISATYHNISRTHLQAYVADGLAAANATLAATVDLQGQLAAIRQRTVDLGLEQLQPGLLEVGGGRLGGPQRGTAERPPFGMEDDGWGWRGLVAACGWVKRGGSQLLKIPGKAPFSD